MKISRVSLVSGKTREMEIPIKEEDYQRWLNGTNIQIAASYLTPDQREFILTGISKEEWDETFKDDEEN